MMAINSDPLFVLAMGYLSPRRVAPYEFLDTLATAQRRVTAPNGLVWRERTE